MDHQASKGDAASKSIARKRPSSALSRRAPLNQKIAKGFLAASITFIALGTVSALWTNPLFIRMTPAGGWEIAALVSLSLLTGLFVSIRRPACSVQSASTGGVIGFLGIACPTCNKVLMLIFGGDLLLTYFEPMRVFLAAAGVLILVLAIGHELRFRHQQNDPSPASSEAG